MTVRRRKPPLALQFAELAWAVPPVVMHRLARLALAGPQPSARDRQEFNRMGAEKSAAFVESWVAMGLQTWKLQQQLAMGLLKGNAGAVLPALSGVMGHGLAPVHRRAVGNARRLGKTPLRTAPKKRR